MCNFSQEQILFLLIITCKFISQVHVGLIGLGKHVYRWLMCDCCFCRLFLVVASVIADLSRQRALPFIVRFVEVARTDTRQMRTAAILAPANNTLTSAGALWNCVSILKVARTDTRQMSAVAGHAHANRRLPKSVMVNREIHADPSLIIVDWSHGMRKV